MDTLPRFATPLKPCELASKYNFPWVSEKGTRKDKVPFEGSLTILQKSLNADSERTRLFSDFSSHFGEGKLSRH